VKNEKLMPLNVVVEGCGHGQLDDIYESCRALERHADKPIDLLICCGDFQAVRNEDDLRCMACPDKYKALGSFWEYYSGRKTAPYPTLFIGGNHEAINFLRELYYGGWAAPNIYFLGYSGVVGFGGIRIGGVSGIFKSNDYLRPHFELPPYSPSSIKSAYHVRAAEIIKLSALEGSKLDVFLSHDWPCGIEKHGDVIDLLRRKKFFKEDIDANRLGSPPSMQLLRALKPAHWFSVRVYRKAEISIDHVCRINRCPSSRRLLPLLPTTFSPTTDDTPHRRTSTVRSRQSWSTREVQAKKRPRRNFSAWTSASRAGTTCSGSSSRTPTAPRRSRMTQNGSRSWRRHQSPMKTLPLSVDVPHLKTWLELSKGSAAT
jgi:lariat debranching enzyme